MEETFLTNNQSGQGQKNREASLSSVQNGLVQKETSMFHGTVVAREKANLNQSNDEQREDPEHLHTAVPATDPGARARVNGAIQQASLDFGASLGAAAQEQQDSWDFRTVSGYVLRAARLTGAYIENSRLAEICGELIGEGYESTVFRGRDPKTVIKLNAFTLVDKEFRFTEFVDRINAQNEFSPKDRTTPIGFTTNKDGEFCIVMQQPFIEGVPATEKDIAIDMKRRGFYPDNIYVGEGDYLPGWSNGQIDIWDAEPKNVMKDADGRLHYIDAIAQHRVIPGHDNPLRLSLFNDFTERIGLNTSEIDLRDALCQRLRAAGIEVITDVKEGQRVLDEENGGIRLQAALGSLAKAANTIKRWLENGTRGKSFTLELPERTRREIRKRMGRDFDSHNITSDGIAHALKNHGVAGKKLDERSIPIRKEDTELIPYIMIAPDYVEKGSTKNSRESVRFYKTLENGNVIVVEKELDNSADDLETINMWGTLSDVSYAQRTQDRTSETPTISRSDAAKIRRDAEIAIENDLKIREQRVYHGSGAEFEVFDHSHMGEGEGLQSFGWGTYVTEVEGIGRRYAEEANRYRIYRLSDVASDVWNIMKEGIPFNEAVATERKDIEDSIQISKNKHNIEDIKTEEENLKKLNELKESDLANVRYLYTVEIPNDNGKNYLDWDGKVPSTINNISIAERIFAEAREPGADPNEIELLRNDIIDSVEEAKTGGDLYKAISLYIGDKNASEVLSDFGYIGIKYYANYFNGGNKEGKKNYVIFNESDAKIVDHVRFFKTTQGEAFGFTVGGKIYIDPRVATAETPIHEYSHLWASALQKGNPKEWQNIVGLMKDTTIWNDIQKKYPELKTDDEIADEVLAHYSGSRGAARLRHEQQRINSSDATPGEKSFALSSLEAVRQAITKFWQAVADLLHLHYTSAEEVADRVLSDLLNGVNSVEVKNEQSEVDVELVNTLFNERLADLVGNPSQKNRVLHLGRTNKFLREGGLEDAEIELEYDKLVRKAEEGYKNKHPFATTDIYDLPKALQSPIAVFENTNGKNNASVILTELKKDGNNFIVAVRAEERNHKGGKKLVVNEITTLFPKDARGIVNWINLDKWTNINKEKALAWLEALRNHRETGLTKEELNSAAKIIKDFKNPKYSEEKISESNIRFQKSNETTTFTINDTINMAEENIIKKTGTERQAEILVAALERAQQNGGVLLNGAQKSKPQFLSRVARIAPVNALVLAMHSDQGEFKTNTYVMYKEAHDRNEAVKRGQKSAPFIWYNQNEYVNKDNPEDKISRATYKILPAAEAAKYKVNLREDVYSVFNIDSTTMSHVNKDEYNQVVAEKGGKEKDLSDIQMRHGFNEFVKNISENLVPIRRDATGIPHYDAKKDSLHIPAQKDYPSYIDYVQDVSRQVAFVTGLPSRLGRSGVTASQGQAPIESQQRKEALLLELTSAHKMLEMGLPAKLRPETMEQLPAIINDLKTNPDMANQVLHDVNRTVGMIKKAENGEKITLHTKPTEARQQAWEKQFPIDKVPQTFERVNLLKDDEGKWTLAAKPEGERTFTVHPSKEDVGMFFDMIKNDHTEAELTAFKNQFGQKYYKELAADPSKEANLFKSDAPKEAVDLISKVNAFKARDNKLLLVATIGDEKQQPREISQSLWQRMWLADDKADFKTQMAAIVYSDVLKGKLEAVKQATSPEVEGTKLHDENEHREYHEEQQRQNSPEQKEKERQEEKAKEEVTKQETQAVVSAVQIAMLKQFDDLKKKHPDAVLLFRHGDFNNMFQQDAAVAAKVLGLTVHHEENIHDKDKGLDWCTFPYHGLDTNLPKLIRAGNRVAICDQLEPAKKQSKSAEPPQEEVKQETKEEVKQDVTQQQERHRGFHR